MSTFTATISGFTRKVEQRIIATGQGAAQDLVGDMKETIPQGGNLPIVTGNLRRSLMASVTAMPSMVGDGDTEFPDNAAQIELVIAGWELATPLYLGWGAIYARKMEYMYGFTRLAAQNWQRHVETNARKAIQAFP